MNCFEVFLKGRVHETFDKGRLYDIHYHIYTPGVSRENHFYPGTRIDGMVRRHVVVNKKVEQSEKNKNKCGTFPLF